MSKKDSSTKKLLNRLKELVTNAHAREEKRIRIELEFDIDEWVLERWGPERVAEDLRWAMENKIRGEVLKRVEVTLDEAVLNKLAKELVDSHDFKKPITEAMHEKLTRYLRNGL